MKTTRSRPCQHHRAVITTGRSEPRTETLVRDPSLNVKAPRRLRQIHRSRERQGSIGSTTGRRPVGVVAELQRTPAGPVAEVVESGLLGRIRDHAPERAVVAVHLAAPLALPRPFGTRRRNGENRRRPPEVPFVIRSTRSKQHRHCREANQSPEPTHPLPLTRTSHLHFSYDAGPRGLRASHIGEAVHESTPLGAR